MRLKTAKGFAVLTVKGRQGWTLDQLISNGERGIVPLYCPAPRWSGYVSDLRGIGIHIETIWEKHGGGFPGRHGKYVLRSQLEVMALYRGGQYESAR